MNDKVKTPVEIEFLAQLEHGEIASQLSLSRRIAISTGLTNALLKRSIRKGLVKVKAVPRRRYAYYLTPKGFQEKSRLVSEYLESSLDFFRKARTQYSEVLHEARQRGIYRIALAGSGELVEIALLAMRDLAPDHPITIIGLYQINEENEENEENANRSDISSANHGLDCLDDAALAQCDAILITESRNPQPMFDLVREHCACKPGQAPEILAPEILAPDLLRITRCKPRFAPALNSSSLLDANSNQASGTIRNMNSE